MKLKKSIAVALFAAISLYAGENWQKVLNESGWCKHAKGYFGTTDEDPHTYPVKGPNARDIGLQGPTSEEWFPVGKLPPTSMPTLPVMVRWDSAQPIRQALVETQSRDADDTSNTLDTPEKYYIITVLGLAVKQKPKSAEEAHDAETRMRQGLLNESRLMMHDRAPIVPADARVDQDTGEIHIYFPRDKPITREDKEVVFGTVFGSVRVIQKFSLKDMMYKGKLSL